jgi:hypothetical protein
MEKTEKENTMHHGKKCDCECCSCYHYRKGRGMHRGEAVYGLGIIGALFYYWGMASSFWLFALGLFKAVFWPGFLVYELLKFLHM